MPEPSKNVSHREANTQLPASAVKTLPSFEVFESKLLPELWQMREDMKRHFVFRAYELAKRKLEMDAWREHLDTQAPQVRFSIRKHRKISTQIRRAIKNITAAEQIATEEDPELLTNLDVIRARQWLAAAESDLQWVIREMFPGVIHPKLREKKEKLTTFKLPQHDDPSFLGFGSQIKHRFIHELGKCFEGIAHAKRTEGRFGRDRIISKIFEIAFSEQYETAKIKTVLARKRRKHKSL